MSKAETTPPQALDWNELPYVASDTVVAIPGPDTPLGKFCRVIAVSDSTITLGPGEDEPHETNIPLAHRMADSTILRILGDLDDFNNDEQWEYLTKIGGRILRIIAEKGLLPTKAS